MSNPPTRAVAPSGVAHIVLNVRDIQVSHRFWTEVMGFQQAGALDNSPGLTMRFYRGGTPGHHHDLALAQVREPAPAPDRPWSMAPRQPGLNHMAIAYPDRDAWLRQIAHLQACGIAFHVRGEHGMSHSVYISDPDGHGIEVLYDLPEAVWEGNLNAALNYFRPLPKEGPEALIDDHDYKVFEAAKS
jgi:catechol 2,3-dioxygenase